MSEQYFPVHVKRLIEHPHETVGPFEQAQRPSEASLCERGRIHGPHARDARRKALPLRNRFGVNAAQRNVVDSGNGNRVSDLLLGKAQQLAGAGRAGDSELDGVIEALCHDRHDRGNATTNFIRNCECQHERFAARRPMLRCREDGAEIIARMAKAARRHVAVKQIDVANEP